MSDVAIEKKPDIGSGTGAWRRKLQRAVGWVVVACALVGMIWIVYLNVFAGFADFDDEGYLMSTVQSFLQGHKLFDQVYTLYGPFYYLVEWAFYGITGLTVSHQTVRWMTFAYWISTSVFFGWCGYRITTSIPVVTIVLFSVSRLLKFFASSPGHPQEICIAVTAILLLTLLRIQRQVGPVILMTLVALLTAASWTKVNVGVYLTFSVLLVCFGGLLARTKRKLAYGATAFASLLLTVAIMLPLLHFHWALFYCICVLLSLVAMEIAAASHRWTMEFPRNCWLILPATAVLVSLIIVVPFLLRGTSLRALIYITLLQHRDFARHWFRVSPFSLHAAYIAGGSFAVAILWFRAQKRGRVNSEFSLAIQILKFAVGLPALYAVAYVASDSITLGTLIMKATAPFSWLLLVHPLGQMSNRDTIQRASLGFLTVLLCLYAFPVAGSQSMFAAIPVTLTAAVLLHDGALALLAHLREEFRMPVRSVAAAVVICVCAWLFCRELRGSHRTWVRMDRLALPGSGRIRVEPEKAATLHWVTTHIQQYCQSFFTMPGMYSFYFWTRQESPTTLTMNDWPAFFNAQQQQEMLTELKQHNTPCVIYNPDLVEFLRAGQDLSASPLARYIKQEFAPIADRSGYYLLMRK
jgi:hypothetical protein